MTPWDHVCCRPTPWPSGNLYAYLLTIMQIMSNVCTIFYEACGAVCADISRWFGRVAARPSCQRRRPPWGWMKCQPSPGAPTRRHHHCRHRCHHYHNLLKTQRKYVFILLLLLPVEGVADAIFWSSLDLYHIYLQNSGYAPAPKSWQKFSL